MISDKLLEEVAVHLNSEITHCGIGEGVGPDVDDATLADELVRKAANSYIDGYEVIKEIYIDETEQNDKQLSNAGVYGASNTVLFAGGEIDVLKKAGESLTVSIEITVERN
jgi:hypothetical protein